MVLKLDPKKILVALFALVVFLVLANTAGGLYVYFFAPEDTPWIVQLFHLDRENNIPSFYSAVALLIAAALLTVIAVLKRGDRFRAHWAGLALIFLYIGIDESVSLHEKLMPVVRNTLDASGFLYFAWVIPYSVMLVVFLVAYAKFVFHLPKRSRLLFVLSGTIYVTGALGFELIGGYFFEICGDHCFKYQVFMTIEETLEMVGVALFIFALTDYLEKEFAGLQIRISSS